MKVKIFAPAGPKDHEMLVDTCNMASVPAYGDSVRYADHSYESSTFHSPPLYKVGAVWRRFWDIPNRTVHLTLIPEDTFAKFDNMRQKDQG